MNTNTPSNSQEGRVPDKSLAAHGSAPVPPQRPFKLATSKEGVELDRTLECIPVRPREF